MWAMALEKIAFLSPSPGELNVLRAQGGGTGNRWVGPSCQFIIHQEHLGLVSMEDQHWDSYSPNSLRLSLRQLGS